MPWLSISIDVVYNSNGAINTNISILTTSLKAKNFKDNVPRELAYVFQGCQASIYVRTRAYTLNAFCKAEISYIFDE